MNGKFSNAGIAWLELRQGSFESLATSAVQAHRSPSPRPSPHGRGRIVGQSSANPQRLFAPKGGARISLSPRERAGVRGNGTSAIAMASLFFGSRAQCAQKIQGVLSLRERVWVGARSGDCRWLRIYRNIAVAVLLSLSTAVSGDLRTVSL